MNSYGMGHEMWRADAAARNRTWAHLQECTARQEQLRQEQDELTREAGPRVGDLVHVTALQLARVVSISGSPPVATIAWEAPTGRGGATVRMQEERWLRDLVAAPEQHASPPLLPLPEPAPELLPGACETAPTELG
jgi:hypothetical protein